MYSGRPHHIKVGVMESLCEAAGLDTQSQVLKLFMAQRSLTASLFSCKQSTRNSGFMTKAANKVE